MNFSGVVVPVFGYPCGLKSHASAAQRAANLVWIFLISGCIKVGPTYRPPPVNVSKAWQAAKEHRVAAGREISQCWWRVFEDPVLNRLVETAYRENLSLSQAGVRVLEARAQLGIAIGQWYPQQQQAFGSVEAVRLSEGATGGKRPSAAQTIGSAVAQSAVRSAVGSFATGALNAAGLTVPNGAGGLLGTGQTSNAAQRPTLNFSQANFGATASWELDFWGRFRRNIESADAAYLSSLADYDTALVSLTADVADTYVTIRTLQRRLVIAQENVKTQQESLSIAEARFKGGTTTQRDVEQARTQLLGTQAAIPLLEGQLQQAQNGLSVLLGMPPSPLTDLLKGSSQIPTAPPRVAVGIPADLLRRRPDIRSAELAAQAQSAQIGVATADLLPAFSLSGTFGFQTNTAGNQDLDDVFQWANRYGSGGPNFQWNFLNYGRIINNVRLQDARFQERIFIYQNTALNAQREVEDALAAFLQNQRRAHLLAQSTQSARHSLDLAIVQYRQGTTDFTTVLTAQLSLLLQQENLAITLGDISRNLVALYRALGGGWEIREGNDVVTQETKEEMAKRTYWGKLLEPAQHVRCEPVKADILPPPPDW